MNQRNSVVQFCIDNSIWNLHYHEGKPQIQFTPSDLSKLKQDCEIIHAIYGGLILGKGHAEGGILMVKPNFEADQFTIAGEMEGDEFLTGPLLHQKEIDFFNAINDNRIPTEQLMEKLNISAVDTRSLNRPILILSPYSHVIINKESTKRYLPLLAAENEKLVQGLP